MIDIAALHRKSGNSKILGKFFATAGYKKCHDYLTNSGLEEEDIAVRTQAYRGAVGIAKVHKLVAMEYIRWVDYNTYANLLEKRLDTDS